MLLRSRRDSAVFPQQQHPSVPKPLGKGTLADLLASGDHERLMAMGDAQTAEVRCPAARHPSPASRLPLACRFRRDELHCTRHPDSPSSVFLSCAPDRTRPRLASRFTTLGGKAAGDKVRKDA